MFVVYLMSILYHRKCALNRTFLFHFFSRLFLEKTSAQNGKNRLLNARRFL